VGASWVRGASPLEQQSTARLVFGFVGTVIVPVAAAAALIFYCVVQFANSFVDVVSHIPGC
jgi:hypothetical protein